jgi:hypothetical protein
VIVMLHARMMTGRDRERQPFRRTYAVSPWAASHSW